MATTSIWRVHGKIGKVLIYAENPDKTIEESPIAMPDGINRDALEDVILYAAREDATNKKQYVSGVNCTPANAREKMLKVKDEYDKHGGVIAYHGYQSFAEGEVTPETAHEIGKRLAERLWGDRFQVLVATHLDKQSHIHNHFVILKVSPSYFCPLTTRSFTSLSHSTKPSFSAKRIIRTLPDQVCV